LRKRDGTTLTFQYDQLDRMIAKLVPERAGLAAAHSRDVYYGYDLRNLQTFARYDGPAGEGVTNAYDAFGRLASSTLMMDGVSRTLSYQWDAGGRRTRVTHPDGYYSSYAFDPAGRLTGIYHANGALLQAFLHDAAGRLWATVRAANNATSHGYDGISRPNSLIHDLPGTAADLALGLAYNPASQLARRTQSNDAYAWTGAYNVARGYTTNGLNQYTAAGTATFAYDANGNLTSDGSTTFTYDVENRLVAASGARTAALRYDPLGRLYEVTGASGTTRFLYDGDALVAEYDAAGARRHLYVHATGADTPVVWYTPTDIRFLHADQQGSIVAISSIVTGTVVGINSYDEYGIPAAGNVGRFQYTGQAWLAELGMYHYKARIYSPTLGRLLQTDPIGYEDQYNLYAYVGNDPINGTDPTGTMTNPCFEFNMCPWGRDNDPETARRQLRAGSIMALGAVAVAGTVAGTVCYTTRRCGLLARVITTGVDLVRGVSEVATIEQQLASGARLVLYSRQEMQAGRVAIREGEVAINMERGWTVGRNDRLISQAIREGRPIRDSYVSSRTGVQIEGAADSMITRERNQIKRAGWQYIRSAREYRPVCGGSRIARAGGC
jgi:RHS repeat-associated protein